MAARARAQQPERMRRIGVLMNSAADEPDGQARLTGFLQGLQEFGWTAGRNIRIDYRWAPDEASHRRYAAELVALPLDVIMASTSASVAALQQASSTVPIVFAAGRVTVTEVGVGGARHRARFRSRHRAQGDRQFRGRSVADAEGHCRRASGSGHALSRCDRRSHQAGQGGGQR